MRFDGHRWAARGTRRFDHVRIESALRQKLDIAQFPRLGVEHVDKDSTDPFALFFGVGNPFEHRQKQLAGVAMNKRDVKVAPEKVDYLVRLAQTQQAGIDKDAGQLVVDRLVQQHRRDRRIDPP